MYDLFIKLKKIYFKNIILYIIQLLYYLAKAKNSLFTIYLDYYKKKTKFKNKSL